MKKTLSIILAILMIVTTMPMAFASGDVIEVNGIGFSDFEEAIEYEESLSEPAELKLLADIEVSKCRLLTYPEGGLCWPFNAKIFDLNGYTIKFVGNLFFVDGSFTITDTSEQGNGKVQAVSMRMIAMWVENTYLTLENGTLEATEGNLHLDYWTEFNMTGGSITNGVTTQSSSSVVNISGGTIAVEGAEGESTFALDCNKYSPVNITGGTFKGGIRAGKDDYKSLRKIVPDGYAIKDADGNYIDKNLFSIGNTVTVEKHNDHKFENCVCNICKYKCFHKDTFVQVEAKANTCTEIGWEAYEYCTSCDYTTKVEIPVDPDAHDIIIDKAVVGDCTNAGLTEGQHCSRCNNATIAQEVIPATGEHIDVDGDTMCDNGGEQLTCEDCRRPVHDDTLVQNFVCWIIMLINLIKTMF